MAEQIAYWRANDGKDYPTEQEAAEVDARLKYQDEIEKYFADNNITAKNVRTAIMKHSTEILRRHDTNV